jgi:hypothetical protein
MQYLQKLSTKGQKATISAVIALTSGAALFWLYKDKQQTFKCEYSTEQILKALILIRKNLFPINKDIMNRAGISIANIGEV